MRKIQAGTDTQYKHLLTTNILRKKLKQFRDTDKSILKLVDRNYKKDTARFIRDNI